MRPKSGEVGSAVGGQLRTMSAEHPQARECSVNVLPVMNLENPIGVPHKGVAVGKLVALLYEQAAGREDQVTMQKSGRLRYAASAASAASAGVGRAVIITESRRRCTV
nr:hypothetical protein CFP56_10150 [Quercus suber]